MVDANIPITNGSGTNEDAIIVGIPADLFAGASDLTVDARQATGTNATLTARFVGRRYVARSVRTPAGWGVVSGSGLATPSW